MKTVEVMLTMILVHFCLTFEELFITLCFHYKSIFEKTYMRLLLYVLGKQPNILKGRSDGPGYITRDHLAVILCHPCK